MSSRRADDIGGRSLMRALAGLRSFGKFLEREGKGKVGALSAIRAPKIGKSLPKPIQMEFRAPDGRRAISALAKTASHGSGRVMRP